MAPSRSPSPPGPTSHSPSACKSFQPNRTNSKTSNGSAGTSKISDPSSPGSDIWGIQLVSRAYRDVPYTSVDPWKPSLMYSIRHIIPEASSLPGTPTSLPPLDDNLSNLHSPIFTPPRTDFGGESHELLEYPFSPHNPNIPTTRPLQYPRKHHTGIRYISALSRSHAVSYGRIHENRHSLSYPSPIRTPTKASYSHFDRSPPHRVGDNLGIERPVQEHSPTQGNIEHLHISDATRSFAVPPPRLTVPAVGTHSRQTSGLQTVVGAVNPFSHHMIQPHIRKSREIR